MSNINLLCLGYAQPQKILPGNIFGTKGQRNNLSKHFPVHILGKSLQPADSVRNLSVWFDSDFFLSKHVQCICWSCFVQLRDFRRVRRYLTADVSVLVVNAIASSHLDYCNSIFWSLFKLNIRKLQCIQNSAARIVTNTSKFSRITPVLKNYTGCPLNIVQYLKLLLLFTNSSILVFHSILTSSHTNVGTTLDAVRMREST